MKAREPVFCSRPDDRLRDRKQNHQPAKLPVLKNFTQIGDEFGVAGQLAISEAGHLWKLQQMEV